MNANPLTATELITKTKEELLRTGYTQLTLKIIDRVWSNLEKYLYQKGIDNFSTEVGMTFLEERYHYSADPKSYSNTDRLRAIQLLADFQAHERIMIRKRQGQRDIAQPFHEVFHTFMNARAREGISSNTMDSYTIYLERFAQYLVDHQVHSVLEIDVSHIHGFVQACAAAYRTATVYCTTSVLRVLFRHLYEQQIIFENLATAVPIIKCSKKSKIPSAYSQEEIQRLLSCIDRGSPKGKRDYAMVLIAVRLGLRASDICRLTFANFKWESNTIELIQKKTNENIVLPLLNDVGEAVIDYIKYSRPTVRDREIFLRLSAPIGPMKPPTLHSIVTFYINKAEIPIPEGKKHGPHALRHSLASALLNNNTPMPVISEILGHTDSQTTSAYLKIDILHLRDFALDVPPVKVVFMAGGWI
ncbi:site-specific integrase [Desulfobulbus alkaliphilus]|uniref:site-specific integrase n=1 Tax=Desulfobulbus alkaliphilus TaxID=869814 RepID=UPI001963C78A|nr:site-specific integrase [Desulfobulbus alkaliphilus]MBM9536916.1 tyrosine-type recombinase/integrase [Desulfobulbus alkaliphilus]